MFRELEKALPGISVAGQVTPLTARDYRYAIDKHLLPFFGNRRLNEITTTVVKSFQTKLHRSQGMTMRAPA